MSLRLKRRQGSPPLPRANSREFIRRLGRACWCNRGNLKKKRRKQTNQHGQKHCTDNARSSSANDESSRQFLIGTVLHDLAHDAESVVLIAEALEGHATGFGSGAEPQKLREMAELVKSAAALLDPSVPDRREYNHQ